MNFRATKVRVKDLVRVLWIPHLVLYLLLPVLAGNSLSLCVSHGDHVALVFGSNASCCQESQGDPLSDLANEGCNDWQCDSCIDIQLTDSAFRATQGRFKSLSAQEDEIPSLSIFHPTQPALIATYDRLPAIGPPVSTRSVLSTIVLLI
jgi:hypothetical protein